MICRARLKSVLMELAVTLTLIAMAIAIVFLLASEEIGVLEIILGVSLSVAFLRSLCKINKVPYYKNDGSNTGLESDKQVFERCKRELHDIAISLSCALAVAFFLLLLWSIKFLVSVAIGFSDWLDAVT